MTDGEHVFAYFGSQGLYCFDMKGNLKWDKDLGDMAVKMSFGGDVEGDTMSGTASFGSRAEDLTWTAERVD